MLLRQVLRHGPMNATMPVSAHRSHGKCGQRGCGPTQCTPNGPSPAPPRGWGGAIGVLQDNPAYTHLRTYDIETCAYTNIRSVWLRAVVMCTTPRSRRRAACVHCVVLLQPAVRRKRRSPTRTKAQHATQTSAARGFLAVLCARPAAWLRPTASGKQPFKTLLGGHA